VGKKSRAKRLIREGNLAPREHAHSRGRQAGLTPANQWVILGAVIVLVVGLAFMLRSALTSGSPTASTATNSTATMQDSMNKAQGAAVGQHVTMANMALPATSGGHVALSRYRGKKLVVYLYEGIT
jgi:hypothetical protein